jgi:phage-related protein
MPEVFGFIPSDQSTADVALRVLSAQFGDGYGQHAADGLHNRGETWALQFVGFHAQVLPVRAFLDAHGGWRAFQWTPPAGEPGLYRAPAYSLTAYSGQRLRLAVSFTPHFAP